MRIFLLIQLASLLLIDEAKESLKELAEQIVQEGDKRVTAKETFTRIVSNNNKLFLATIFTGKTQKENENESVLKNTSKVFHGNSKAEVEKKVNEFLAADNSQIVGIDVNRKNTSYIVILNF